jgi:hypothetical protein
MARVLIALQLKSLVLDVIDGGQDDPLVVLFDSDQNRLSPDIETERWGRRFLKIYCLLLSPSASLSLQVRPHSSSELS